MQNIGKLVLTFIILVVVISLILFLLVALFEMFRVNKSECPLLDYTYCELVYTNCDCYARPRYFFLQGFPTIKIARQFKSSALPQKNESCDLNYCVENNVTTRCFHRRCVRSDAKICDSSGQCAPASEWL